MRPLAPWIAICTFLFVAGGAHASTHKAAPAAHPSAHASTHKAAHPTHPSAHHAKVRRTEVGIASYYDHGFHGHRTASGKVYDRHGMTAAHRTLPFGTRVRVTNLRNHRSVVLLITDRGPFARGRIIDISPHAARKLGFWHKGTARVRVEVLRAPAPSGEAKRT